ncbi:MAG: aminotransferase class V-fold PLP-dependent enzyme [Candidatus Aminicenantes bacterium]|nr:aminotransferase class V-fold PLP-dependent enzyme [Candidatus Aminicenantes bacterium]
MPLPPKNHQETETTESSTGLTRRDFFRYLAGSALSLAALDKATAAVYQSITGLNQKYYGDESPDGLYWDGIRRQFLFEDGLIMMNNGTVGPLPKPVFNTLMRYFRIQATNPYDVYNFLPTFKEETRAKLAAFINASPEEVVLTHNTTEGINFVTAGLDMKEGDEVVISNMEHPGAIHPWKLKEKRSGIVIKEVPFGLPTKSVDEVVGSVAAAITPRTKIISLGHTVFITGLISPLKELSQMAHEKGVLVLGDSAHGLGMLELNMKDMGIDFFASSPYKWLGAPTGIGLLFVRKEAQDKLWPTIVTGGWDTYQDARKFECHGQDADALIFALGEALDFQNAIGRRRIERRIKTLAGYLKQELRKIPGAKIHTPDDPYLSGGLTAFSVEGVDPAKIVDYAREKYNIVVRTIGNKDAGTYGVRVSTHYYITTRDIDNLVEGVRTLASHRT